MVGGREWTPRGASNPPEEEPATPKDAPWNSRDPTGIVREPTGTLRTSLNPRDHPGTAQGRPRICQTLQENSQGPSRDPRAVPGILRTYLHSDCNPYTDHVPRF